MDPVVIGYLVDPVVIAGFGDRDDFIVSRNDPLSRATPTPWSRWPSAGSAAVEAVAIGRVGGRDIIVSGSADNTVQIWDPATGKAITVCDLEGPIYAMGVHPHFFCVAVSTTLCVLEVGAVANSSSSRNR